MGLEGKDCKTQTSRIIFWGLLLLALIPWFMVSLQQAANSDNLWLCEELKRYLTGHKLSTDAYDLNPPLAFLIYALPVLGQMFLGLPLHYLLYFQTLFLIVFAAYASHRILSRWNLCDQRSTDTVIAGFVLASTLGSYIFFGERDHMTGIMLVPFVLVQLSITMRWPVPKGLKWPVLILGAILILVKPHYGIFPVLLLAHRIFKNRNIGFLKDSDFLTLACCSILYIVGSLYFFPDYFSIILPDAIALYLPLGNWNNVGATILAAILMIFALIAGMLYTPAEQNERRVAYALLGGGLCALIPYYLQKMGFYYQLLPAIIFFEMAYAAILLSWFKAFLPRNVAVFVSLIILIIVSYMHAPPNKNFPTHADYQNLTLSKVLQKDCPRDKPCSFFMFNKNMGIMHETAYYNHLYHASRFSCFWFMHTLIEAKSNLEKGLPSTLTKPQLDSKISKYSSMIAEDLAQKKPDILVILIDYKALKYDFIPFFSHDQKFRDAMAHYKKIESFKMSYHEYYHDGGTDRKMLTYDVYRRQGP